MSTITRRIIPAIAVAGTMMLVATGCVAGENATADEEKTPAAGSEWSSDTLSIDFATYNPAQPRHPRPGHPGGDPRR